MKDASRTARDNWKRELQPTSACVPVERFGAELNAGERDHIAHCAHCEAEFALWEEFRSATPSPDEGAAVQWIAAELGRRHSSEPPTEPRVAWWTAWLRPQAFGAAAAALVAVFAISYVIQDREPSMGTGPTSGDVYRSTRLELEAPTGDLSSPPTSFHWVSMAGAASYDVEVQEVDRTMIWRTSTSEPHVDIPPAVVARFLPGKAVVWQVTARRSDGTVVAQSGSARFRVVVTTPPQRE